MNLPEYLTLFSNQGNMKVHVQFKNQEGSVATQMMSPQEISALISNDRNGFHTHMTFDEHPFVICKYEIDPAKNQLLIVAKRAP